MSVELITQFREARDELKLAITELKKRGYTKAEAERDYRIALAKEMLRLKAEGKPATVLSDLARGQEEIANLKMQRDIAESLYESALQKIYQTKIEIAIMEKDIEFDRRG